MSGARRAALLLLAAAAAAVLAGCGNETRSEMAPEEQRDSMFDIAEDLAARLGGDYSRRDLGGNTCSDADGSVVYSLTLSSPRSPQPLDADVATVQQLLRERGLDVGIVRKPDLIRVGGTSVAGIVDYEVGPGGHTIGAATSCGEDHE